MAHLQDLVKFYFMLGLRHGEMLLLLSTVDDIALSMSKLRIIFKGMGLYRRNESDPLEVASFRVFPGSKWVFDLSLALGKAALARAKMFSM